MHNAGRIGTISCIKGGRIVFVAFMAHSVTISVDTARWSSRSSTLLDKISNAMARWLDRLFSHRIFVDINASYARALGYNQLDALAIRLLWVHGIALGLLLMLNAYVRLPDIFRSPLGWRAISPHGAIILLAIGLIALALPMLVATRMRNHYVWRLILSLSLATYSYLFVYVSGGSVVMYFHAFLVMAVAAIYADKRLIWVLFAYYAIGNVLSDTFMPAQMFYYGHNELSVPVQTAFMLVMAYFASYLCQNHRDSMVALVAAKQRNDQFLAIASHELKTPLTSMKGYTEVLERKLKRGGQTELVQYTDRLDDQLSKMSGMIRDLLDISKLQAGMVNMRRERISINSVVEQSIEEVQALTRHHKVSVSGWANSAVYGDPVRLCQVLVNLLSNAIKYSPTSDRVVVKVTEARDRVVISVQDFGIGISPDESESIFEPYFRSQQALREDVPGGLGMGLYIAQEIVRRHSGRIWVDSEVGKGSIFSFFIPVIRENKTVVMPDSVKEAIRA